MGRRFATWGKNLENDKFSHFFPIFSLLKQCFSIRVQEGHDHGREYFSKGCIKVHEFDYCKTKLGGRSLGQLQAKCCVRSFCNNETMETFVTYQNQTVGSIQKHPYLFSIVILSAIGVLSVILGSIWWSRRTKERVRGRREGAERNQPVSIPLMESSISQQSVGNLAGSHLIATAAGDSTLREVFDHSITSGSGSGLPVLTPRTIAHDIHQMELIGKGRFADVHRGRLEGQDVAVKIFPTWTEPSLFEREREIYHLLGHGTILGYKRSDVTSVSSCTQRWLVLEFCHLGSLYDFLTDANFCSPISDIVSILKCAITGLDFMHNTIDGTRKKPAIAHRDIKSKNIYIRDTYPRTACIGDFGLSVTYIGNSVNVGNPNKIGSPRYSAPEVVDQSIKSDRFESFKQADIYSFALVMWESCQRAAIVGEPEEYQSPYQEFVSPDPSVEEMRKVVVLEGLRPTIPDLWYTLKGGRCIPDMALMADLISQSWNQKPESRLTALNIKQKLRDLFKQQTP